MGALEIGNETNSTQPEEQVESSQVEATAGTDTSSDDSTNQEETTDTQTGTETTEGAEETSTEGEETESSEETSEDEGQEDFDYSKYEQEFLDTGDISEDSRKELYKLFPKNLVDNYIDNMKNAMSYAIAETEKKAFDVVGGEDNYKQLMEWAGKNLDEDEKDLFNETVSGSNEKLALQAIKGLKARMDLDTSKKPKIVMGDDGSTNDDAGDVFLTRQDYANAISKPEYQTSPQYRAEIEAKLKRTLKNGGYKG